MDLSIGEGIAMAGLFVALASVTIVIIKVRYYGAGRKNDFSSTNPWPHTERRHCLDHSGHTEAIKNILGSVRNHDVRLKEIAEKIEKVLRIVDRGRSE